MAISIYFLYLWELARFYWYKTYNRYLDVRLYYANAWNNRLLKENEQLRKERALLKQD